MTPFTIYLAWKVVVLISLNVKKRILIITNSNTINDNCITIKK